MLHHLPSARKRVSERNLAGEIEIGGGVEVKTISYGVLGNRAC
jgi:hypothetical protein